MRIRSVRFEENFFFIKQIDSWNGVEFQVRRRLYELKIIKVVYMSLE